MPKHILLYDYFGWQAPKFLHTVLFRNEERKKLSKRDGDTSLKWYRGQGYLPSGIRNFLSRLLWPHPDNKDVYSFEEFCEKLDLSKLGVTGPIASLTLLSFINAQHMTVLTPEQRLEAVLGYMDFVMLHGEDILIKLVRGEDIDEVDLHVEEVKKFVALLRQDENYALKIMGLEAERMRQLPEALLNNRFFFPSLYTPASSENLLKHIPEAVIAVKVLNHLHDAYSGALSHDGWNDAVKKITTDLGLKAAKGFMLARSAITGVDKSPPLFEVMQVLGEGEVKKRLSSAIEALSQTAAA